MVSTKKMTIFFIYFFFILGPRVIKVTPTTYRKTTNISAVTKTDHEYFSTPISNAPITPSSRIYITPTQGSSSASSPAGHLILPNAKVEARRRLNLDSAAMVDQDGFKTPIKGGTKRKADFSSPSPKKCKIRDPIIYRIFMINCRRNYLN